jgi:hypothetical protein
MRQDVAIERVHEGVRCQASLEFAGINMLNTMQILPNGLRADGIRKLRPWCVTLSRMIHA